MNARCLVATGVVALSCAAGCGVNHSEGLTPVSVKINGEAAPDLVSFNVAFKEANPSDTLIKRWDPNDGLLLRVDGHYVWRCGHPIKIEAGNRIAHGRLILFNHLEMAETPAGHGNYTIQVGPDIFRHIDGGRRYTLWEGYRVGKSEYYAWILILAEDPLRCNGSL